jgi:hypothetical protein
MLAVKGRYNGATVVLDSIPNSLELGTPIKECDVIVNKILFGGLVCQV